MKKYYYLLVAMMMAVMTIGLTACGDDNDEPEGGEIVGTWFCDTNQRIIDTFDNIYASGEALYQFKANGTYIAVDIAYYTDEWADAMSYDEEFTNPDIIIERGTYHLSGNKLRLEPNDNSYKITYECEVKSNSMTLTFKDGIVFAFNFTRVPDSRIEKYL